MHELGITRNLVGIVADAAKGRRVRKVWLEIGRDSNLLPDAVRFCFDVVSKGTPLESAALEIVEVVPGWQCQGCSVALGDLAPDACIHCGSVQLRRRVGDELNIKAMEVETCA